MAGECLGELGVVDPFATAFSFGAQESSQNERLTNEQQMKTAKVRDNE